MNHLGLSDGTVSKTSSVSKNLDEHLSSVMDIYKSVSKTDCCEQERCHMQCQSVNGTEIKDAL